MVAPKIINKLVKDLKPHELNAKIYDDEADDTLIKSVKESGVLQPLLADKNNRVISGHRRLDAAIRAGLLEVPVTFFPSDDEWDIETALIESNRQRAKSNEQIAREAAALLIVEQEKARQRQVRGKPQKNLPAISPDGTGDARDVVAKKLGIGAKKVDQSAAVVGAIDRLTQEGSEEDAKKLCTELNKFSVNRAHKVALEGGFLRASVTEESADEEDYILISDWEKMSHDQKTKALAKEWPDGKFNRQESDGIGWAHWSWNPMTGCLQNCEYCFARDSANHRLPQGFAPSFYPGRLKAPGLMKLPADASADFASKNVFTCSMADLFGKWVPSELIQMVLDAARNAPLWNYVFLTKFPGRLTEFQFPDNAWVGTTVDTQARVAAAEAAFEKVQARVKCLSCEPLKEQLTFKKLNLFQWIMIGGASKSTQTPEFKPPREWVQHLWAQADKVGCKIFEKANLLERRRELPMMEPDKSK
ncbi:MAG: DUF5131 family protein [Verrucomicrobiota bacterium]